MNKNIVLYENKKDCCGCNACVNICRVSALFMEKDEFGFIYPKIKRELCVGCKKCIEVCHWRKKKEETKRNTMKCYAAIGRSEEIVYKSASGGVFGSIAKELLKNQGIVYGCSMEYENGHLTAKHIGVAAEEELIKLQGSKYVQSDMGNCFEEVQLYLEQGKKVLFSGTPCQIAALKQYIGKKEKNLFTIDLICHGVPGQAIFQNFIKELEEKYKAKIIQFQFRDKSSGGYSYCKIVYRNKREKTKFKIIKNPSYYQLFLNGYIYRESCYSCKYANDKREGDLTIGDFWGIEKEHPDYFHKNNGKKFYTKGISCVLVNTENGKKLIEFFGNGIEWKESSFDQIAKYNQQLKVPVKKEDIRERLLKLYRDKGYKEMERYFDENRKEKRTIDKVWNVMPYHLQLFLCAIKNKMAR